MSGIVQVQEEISSVSSLSCFYLFTVNVTSMQKMPLPETNVFRVCIELKKKAIQKVLKFLDSIPKKEKYGPLYALTDYNLFRMPTVGDFIKQTATLYH